MTVTRTRPFLSHDRHPISAEVLAVLGAGWRVTAPPRCPTMRAVPPSSPRTSAARVARDIRTPPAAPGAAAGARARRRDGPALHVRDGRAPASASARSGTPPRTRAGWQPPTPPARTTAGTRCTASADALASTSPRSSRSPRSPGAGFGVRVDHDPAAARGGRRSRVDLYAAAKWITSWAPLKQGAHRSGNHARPGSQACRCQAGEPAALSAASAFLPD